MAAPTNLALDVLLGQYRFSGVAAVVRAQGRSDDIAMLADAGERLLDLDAEDFDLLAGEGVLPSAVRQEVHAALFPRQAHSPDRGSLGSLVPLYGLMLEAVEARWRRGNPVHITVLLHLIAQYFPLLAWELVLGHAGDPLRLPEHVSVEGSRWGTHDPDCSHPGALASAAERSLHATESDARGWTLYLDRFHSRVSDALAVCGVARMPGRSDVPQMCRNPCAVATTVPSPVREELDARIRLGQMYADSEVVALRHHAPVGHFFGVPDLEEITTAWQRSYTKLTRPWRDGANPLSATESPLQEALPGLHAVVEAVAGRPVPVVGVLDQVRSALRAQLALESPVVAR